MRPRHEAVENSRDTFAPSFGSLASMRPRHEAVENRQEPGLDHAAQVHASMRPRHEAVENGARPLARAAIHQCFNEATARGRGKPAGAPKP